MCLEFYRKYRTFFKSATFSAGLSQQQVVSNQTTAGWGILINFIGRRGCVGLNLFQCRAQFLQVSWYESPDRTQSIPIGVRIASTNNNNNIVAKTPAESKQLFRQTWIIRRIDDAEGDNPYARPVNRSRDLFGGQVRSKVEDAPPLQDRRYSG